MSDDLLKALAPFADWAQKLLAERPHYARLVRDVGRLLVAVAAQPGAPAAAHPTPSPVSPVPIAPPVGAKVPTLPVPTPPIAVLPVPLPPPVTPPPPPPPPPLPPSPQRFLTVSEAFPALHPPGDESANDRDALGGDAAYYGTWYRSVYDEELPEIEERCRIKADACRWAEERCRLLRSECDFARDIDPRDQELIARARELPDCFLWMFHRDWAAPIEPAQFGVLAGCFDTMGTAMGLLNTLVNNPEQGDSDAFQAALDLAAETQSSVRAVILSMKAPTDGDQQKVFSWLRSAASERKTLIRRFMKKDDPADPKNWPDLLERVRQVERKLQRYKNRDKLHKNLVGKIRYHSKRIADDPSYNWSRIVETIDELIREGMQPSNVDLRNELLPLHEDIPVDDNTPKNVKLVMREIDRYLSAKTTKAEGIKEEKPTAEMRQAAELLRGRALVMIGGDRRPFAEEALIAALGLTELFWIETREHQTHTVFEPYVARDDVVLVLLAIRWSSHSFGEVKDFCDKYGKPLVHLPGGYNPSQVAFHVVNQVAEKLRGDRAAVAAG